MEMSKLTLTQLPDRLVRTGKEPFSVFGIKKKKSADSRNSSGRTASAEYAKTQRCSLFLFYRFLRVSGRKCSTCTCSAALASHTPIWRKKQEMLFSTSERTKRGKDLRRRSLQSRQPSTPIRPGWI